MNSQNLEVLQRDFEESVVSAKYFLTRAKLVYYIFARVLYNQILKARLRNKIPTGFPAIKFLNREGGMFKSWVYFICNKKHAIKNSDILIPGAGFGHCIFQLAAFHPRRIVAFDVYEYTEEWNFVTNKCKAEFGVEVIFKKGGFEVVDDAESFDWIISDAVLEHVKDLDRFMNDSYKHLKVNGWFYASFGPIWFGPGGDHVDWGSIESSWDHLIIETDKYEKRFNERGAQAKRGTLQGDFLFHGKLFSYLKAEQYFDIFKKYNFNTQINLMKVNFEALEYLEENNEINKKLDGAGTPPLDRFVDGFLVWLKKHA
jgi:SAM-dependent methyltransferase